MKERKRKPSSFQSGLRLIESLSRKPFGAKAGPGADPELAPLLLALNRIIAKGSQKITRLEKKTGLLSARVEESEKAKGQIRESMGELLRFQKLSEAISAAHNVEGVLDALDQLSRGVLPIEASAVFLMDRQAGKLSTIRPNPFTPEQQEAIREQFEEGILDWVIRERFPAVIPDIRRTVGGGAQECEHNFIIIPLIMRGQGIGVYHIYTHATKSDFTRQQLELLSLLSNVAAVAIENSRLYEQMNRTIKELAVLYETGKKVSSVLKPSQVYRTSIAVICEKLSVTMGWILEWEYPDTLLLRAQFGDHALPERIPADAFARDVLEKGEPVFLDAAGLRVQAGPWGALPLQSLVCAPLSYRGNAEGLIAVGAEPGGTVLEPYHLRLLHTMANQVSIAIENGKLYQELLQVNQNLTDMQWQLIHSGKLAAVGQLAGGVAHEINNPLQIILGRVQMVMSELENPSHRAELEIIESETKRIASIVRGLLEFAKEGEKGIEFRPVDINRILSEAAVLVRHQMEVGEILLDEEYAPDLPQVMGDPGMLKQVFLNLAINARQSMKPGDRLILRSGREASWVTAEFADTGSGIAPELLDRIFEPFFTTKEKSGGTGLGLSVSYGIIEKHNGTITVKSQLEKGTVFTVKIPMLPAGEGIVA